MDFFREHPVNDSVLSGLGIHDQKTRSLLIGHFNSLLCYSSDDFGKALVVLLEATSTVAQRAVASDAALDSLRLENLRLSTKLGEMEDEARALRAEGELARMQKADLIVIVDKQREGLAAYKEKCAMHRKEGKEMRGAYDRLMRRAAGLEALNASLGADKAALECRLRVAEASAENERAVRLKARRARKEWASRSGSAPLPRLHGLFRAAVGVASASSLMTAAGRAQRLKAPGSKVAMGRRRAAHFLSVAAERDDALRAKEALEQELQRVREQAAHARRGLAASSDELLSLRAELRRRSDAERAIREQHFYDSFVGAPIVCPMPTMDGSLVALADIYREWRPSSSSSSSGDGRAVAASSDFAFAATGARRAVAPGALIQQSDIRRRAFWQVARRPRSRRSASSTLCAVSRAWSGRILRSHSSCSFVPAAGPSGRTFLWSTSSTSSRGCAASCAPEKRAGPLLWPIILVPLTVRRWGLTRGSFACSALPCSRSSSSLPATPTLPRVTGGKGWLFVRRRACAPSASRAASGRPPTVCASSARATSSSASAPRWPQSFWWTVSENDTGSAGQSAAVGNHPIYS